VLQEGGAAGSATVLAVQVTHLDKGLFRSMSSEDLEAKFATAVAAAQDKSEVPTMYWPVAGLMRNNVYTPTTHVDWMVHEDERCRKSDYLTKLATP
jgi:hypothetical protein